MYGAHQVVKAFNGEKASVEQFNVYNNELYQSAWKSNFLSGLMQPLSNFVGNLGYVAVCIVGALLTMNNIISFGIIVAFIVYI